MRSLVVLALSVLFASHATAQQNDSKEYWEKRYTVDATCSDFTSFIEDYEKISRSFPFSAQDGARVSTTVSNVYFYTFIRSEKLRNENASDVMDEATFVKYANELGSFCKRYPDFKHGSFFDSFTEENKAEKMKVLEKMLAEVRVQENPTITHLAKYVSSINSKFSKTK